MAATTEGADWQQRTSPQAELQNQHSGWLPDSRSSSWIVQEWTKKRRLRETRRKEEGAGEVTRCSS